MPVSKLRELPPGTEGRWPTCGKGFRSVQWGDMEVGLTTVGPTDPSKAYKGLPGGVCICPHHGYVFSGRIRCVYPGTTWPDEFAEAGDVYFFNAGHYLIYEEETEAFELNPAHALQTIMDHLESVAGAHMK
jgi:hypothetical protein